MHLSWRDSIATVLVAIGVVVYGAWVAGPGIPGFVEPASVALAILVLGVAASILAVVPGFDELLRGSRTYLAGASALGVIAFGAGVWTIAAGAAAAGLAVLVVATVVLWAMSTMRHAGVSVGRPHQPLPRS
ncbi:MAG TPA: hypothetical protein VK194_02645 [Candidatus Deferrimicrobium sp.]|nr:hypothetical protein [Candidatus Deferrimicrobium sp.]